MKHKFLIWPTFVLSVNLINWLLSGSGSFMGADFYTAFLILLYSLFTLLIYFIILSIVKYIFKISLGLPVYLLLGLASLVTPLLVLVYVL